MKTIEVVAAIIKKDNKIFITRRGYGEFIHMWEFPGGKMEIGETKEQALVREIKEELDTEISVDEFLTTIEYDYPNFHLIMHCFWCHVVNGQLKLLEHEDSKWISINEIDGVDWLPADILVVEKIKKSGYCE